MLRSRFESLSSMALPEVRPATSLKQGRELVGFAKTSQAAGGRGETIDATKLRSLLPGIRLPYDNYPGVKWAGVADCDGEIVGGDGGNYRKAREAVGTVLGGAPPAAAALHIPEAGGLLKTRTRRTLIR